MTAPTPSSSAPMSDEQEDELRAQIYKIWGLETAPDGQPNFILTKEEDGTVIEGADYTNELEQTVALIAHHTKEAVEAARIDENRLSQRCFDGMTGAPGDQFSKHFAKLIERGFELATPTASPQQPKPQTEDEQTI